MKEIALTGGGVTLVDDGDYERLMDYRWHLITTGDHAGYASRCINGGGHQVRVLMHRILLNAPADMEVHHWDLNSLNNQKSNLVLCTTEEHRRMHAQVTRSKTTAAFIIRPEHAAFLLIEARQRRVSKSEIVRAALDLFISSGTATHTDGDDSQHPL